MLLRENADRLAELIGSSRRVVSPLPGDGLVQEQAQEIHRMLAGLSRGIRLSLALTQTPSRPRLMPAMRDLNAATNQLDNGNWLIRAERATDWIRPQGAWEYPQIQQTLAADSMDSG